MIMIEVEIDLESTSYFIEECKMTIEEFLKETKENNFIKLPELDFYVHIGSIVKVTDLKDNN